MAQNITIGIKQLCDEANKVIETVTAEQAIELHKDDNVVIVDIRMSANSRVKAAFPAPITVRAACRILDRSGQPLPQGRVHPGQELHFSMRRRLRSALATEVAQRMGLHPVFNMAGGFGAWRDAGGPIEEYTRK